MPIDPILLRKLQQNDISIVSVDFKTCGVNLRDPADVTASLKQLRDALKGNTHVQYLNLNSCFLADSDVVILSELLETNTSIVILSLCDNKITDLGAEIFANTLTRNQSLQQVNLTYNQITIRGKTALSDALERNSLITDLSCDDLINPKKLKLNKLFQLQKDKEYCTLVSFFHGAQQPDTSLLEKYNDLFYEIATLFIIQQDVDVFDVPSEVAQRLSEDEKRLFQFARLWNPFIATLSGRLDLLKKVLSLERGERFADMADDHGQTLLHKAAKYGYDQLCVFFLEQGVRPNVKDQGGNYAFGVPPIRSVAVPVIRGPSNEWTLLGKGMLYSKWEELKKLLRKYGVQEVDLTTQGGIVVKFESDFNISEKVAGLRKEINSLFDRTNIAIIEKNLFLAEEPYAESKLCKLDSILEEGRQQTEFAQRVRSTIQDAELLSLIVGIRRQMSTGIVETEILSSSQRECMVRLGEMLFNICPDPAGFHRPEYSNNSPYTLLTKEEQEIIQYARLWNQHYVAANNNVELMKVLLQYGIQVNQVEPIFGKTCLYQAYFSRHYEMCVLLLKNGADPESINPANKSETGLLLTEGIGMEVAGTSVLREHSMFRIADVDDETALPPSPPRVDLRERELQWLLSKLTPEMREQYERAKAQQFSLDPCPQ